MRKSLLALAAFALLVVALSWVAPASAAPPGPQYVSVSGDLFDGNGRLVLLAQCPTGGKVVGGGYEMSFFPDVNGSLMAVSDGIEDSYPDSAANGWRVVFEQTHSPYASGVHLTAWAVCT